MGLISKYLERLIRALRLKQPPPIPTREPPVVNLPSIKSAVKKRKPSVIVEIPEQVVTLRVHNIVTTTKTEYK